MAKILKISKKSSLKSAIDLGIAMQLTNISRDVVEDLNNNDDSVTTVSNVVSGLDKVFLEVATVIV